MKRFTCSQRCTLCLTFLLGLLAISCTNQSISATETVFDRFSLDVSGPETRTPPINVADTDNDGVEDVSDNCPKRENADQEDFDSDKMGNACDDDDDNDGVEDSDDALPLDALENSDFDGDGEGDNADQDDDDDGYWDWDEEENGTDPYDDDDQPTDFDGDKISDMNDRDIDGDGGQDTSDPYPYDPQQAYPWKAVRVGSQFACTLKNISGYKLFCWGSNMFGQLGRDSALTAPVSTPVPLGNETIWTSFSSGTNHACGVRDSGRLYCWGSDQFGQLGDGSTLTNRTAPVQIGSNNQWTSVAAGDRHSCGILNGELYCWGSNDHGQLGTGDNQSQFDPVQIGGWTDWTSVSAGHIHTCAIRASRLYCWGGDDNNQLGNGPSTGAISEPTQIGLATTWESVAAGRSHSCGIKSSQLYCWGNDTYGQLGNNYPTVDEDSPAPVGEDVGWSNVSLGNHHSCGILNSHALCWGRNDTYLLGTATTSPTQTVPIQISTKVWSDLDAGESFSCGISERKMFCWGTDSYGMLTTTPTSLNEIIAGP